MAVEHSIEIAAPAADLFAFLADACNDPRWCATVVACDQLQGDRPGPNARYTARHKPTPLHRTMPRSIEVLEYEPPHRIHWRQEDGNGVFLITYEVEPTTEGARFTQRDAIEWKVPRPVGRLAERLFVRRHISDQMVELKRLLEGPRTR